MYKRVGSASHNELVDFLDEESSDASSEGLFLITVYKRGPTVAVKHGQCVLQEVLYWEVMWLLLASMWAILPLVDGTLRGLFTGGARGLFTGAIPGSSHVLTNSYG